MSTESPSRVNPWVVSILVCPVAFVLVKATGSLFRRSGLTEEDVEIAFIVTMLMFHLWACFKQRKRMGYQDQEGYGYLLGIFFGGLAVMVAVAAGLSLLLLILSFDFPRN